MPLFVPFQRDPCHYVNTRLQDPPSLHCKIPFCLPLYENSPNHPLTQKTKIDMLFVNRSPLYFACCEQQSGCIKWWREDRYDDYYYDMHEWSKIGDRGRDGVEWRCKSLDFSTFYTHTSSIHIHLTRKTCAHTDDDDDAGDKQSL